MRILPLMAAVAVAGLLAALPAAAQLYTCKNDGRITFSSQPGENCTLQKSYEHTRNPTAAPKAEGKKQPQKPAAKPVPRSKMPVVSAATQKVRDQAREAILQQELRRENQLFSRIRDLLAAEQAKTPPNEKRLAALQDEQHIREQNIIAIQQELARLQ